MADVVATRVSNARAAVVKLKFQHAIPVNRALVLPANFVLRPETTAPQRIIATATAKKRKSANAAIQIAAGVKNTRIPPAALVQTILPDESTQAPPREDDAAPAAVPLYSIPANYAAVSALGAAYPPNTPIFKIMRINAGKQGKNAIRGICDGGHDYEDAVDMIPRFRPSPQLSYINTLKRKYLTGPGTTEEFWRTNIKNSIFTNTLMARPEAIKEKLENLNPFGPDPDQKPLKDNLVEIRNRKDPNFNNIFSIPLESGAFGFSVDASTFNPIPHAVSAKKAAETINWIYFPTQEVDAASRPGPVAASNLGAIPINLTQTILRDKFKLDAAGLTALDEYSPPEPSVHRTGVPVNPFTVYDYYDGSKHIFYSEGADNVVEIWHKVDPAAAAYTHMATLRVKGGVSVNALSEAILGVIARGNAEEAGSPVRIVFHASTDTDGANVLIVKQILDWMQAYFIALLWHYYQIKIVLITNDNFLLRIAKWLMVPWMIFMTKDGAQLYSFDNAAMAISAEDKLKIQTNILQVAKVEGANKPAITSFLEELDSIIALFTNDLIAEPFIYLLKQEALRIKDVITTELTTLQNLTGATITDEIMINNKFLMNMNFIDYAFSLYQSGFSQKISDFALGASRIAAAVGEYRKKHVAARESTTLLGNLIALLKVYIPEGPNMTEQIGLWLTLLDFCGDGSSRIQVIKSIIADLAKIEGEAVAGTNPPQGAPNSVLDAFQKFSAITMSKSSGAVPCIAFNYFEAGFPTTPCVIPVGARWFPFTPFGKYSGFTNGPAGEPLAAPRFAHTKDSSISITRKFKNIYEEYIKSSEIRVVDGYSKSLSGIVAGPAAAVGGSRPIIQKGGAYKFIDPRWAQKTTYELETEGYGITEKYMHFTQMDNSFQYVAKEYRRKKGKDTKGKVKQTERLWREIKQSLGATQIHGKYRSAAILPSLQGIIDNYEQEINTVRTTAIAAATARGLVEPDFSRFILGSYIQFCESHTDEEYNKSKQFMTISYTDTQSQQEINARKYYRIAINSLLETPKSDPRGWDDAAARKHNTLVSSSCKFAYIYNQANTAEATAAWNDNPLVSENYIGELSRIAADIDLDKITQEAAGGAGGAGPPDDPEERAAGLFRWLEFILYDYLKIYHDLYRGTSIDGEYDLFLQEIAELRAKRYMGIITTQELWGNLISLILDESVNNSYSCIHSFLFNTPNIDRTKIFQILTNVIRQVFAGALQRALAAQLESVYELYQSQDVALNFPEWGWGGVEVVDETLDEEFDVAMASALEDPVYPIRISVIERTARLAGRNSRKPTASAGAGGGGGAVATATALKVFEQAYNYFEPWEIEEMEEEEYDDEREYEPLLTERWRGGAKSNRKSYRRSLRKRIGKRRSTHRQERSTASAKSRRTRRRK
jgi:hypothetical protein